MVNPERAYGIVCPKRNNVEPGPEKDGFLKEDQVIVRFAQCHHYLAVFAENVPELGHQRGELAPAVEQRLIEQVFVNERVLVQKLLSELIAGDFCLEFADRMPGFDLDALFLESVVSVEVLQGLIVFCGCRYGGVAAAGRLAQCFETGLLRVIASDHPFRLGHFELAILNEVVVLVLDNGLGRFDCCSGKRVFEAVLLAMLVGLPAGYGKLRGYGVSDQDRILEKQEDVPGAAAVEIVEVSGFFRHLERSEAGTAPQHKFLCARVAPGVADVLLKAPAGDLYARQAGINALIRGFGRAGFDG